MTKLQWLTVVVLCTSFLPTVSAQEEGWTPLFDGKTLDGWTQRGGKAVYEVVDGTIMGSTRPNTPNSFLCTNRNYGDFELELDYKVDQKLNSGIQIRSNSLASYRRGQVHGYQVEIDPTNRAYSAGIYDEGRRGWLNPPPDPAVARDAFRQNDWNHYRIVAMGDSLRTWMNGVPIADLVDSLTLTGFIGLQVHSVGARKDPLRIQWRNIRIRDLGRHEWKPMLEGDLEGWHVSNGGNWKVNGTTVVATRAAKARHGLLVTDREFSDFTLRMDFKSVKGNSGLYFRVDEVDGPVACHGFQAEVSPDFDTGGLYETAGRAWVAKAPDGIKKWYKPGRWSRMTVSAHGERTVVSVNDRKTSDILDKKGRRKGHIALQLHGGQEMHVEFRGIQMLVPVSPKK